MYGLALMLALPGWPLILLAALPQLIPLAQQAGIHWSVPVVGLLTPIGALVWWLMPPNTTTRGIVIDTGRDQLVAYNEKGRVVRQLSTLKNLTVEPHPRAEWERQKKRGAVGPFQKQLCLFGWFGAHGAEKVSLMTRCEYPPQDSLFELSLIHI